MYEKQNASKNEANSADDDVSEAKETIFAAENWRCREDERFCSVELCHGVAWGIKISLKNNFERF